MIGLLGNVWARVDIKGGTGAFIQYKKLEQERLYFGARSFLELLCDSYDKKYNKIN